MGTHIGSGMTDEKVRCDYQPLSRLKRKMFFATRNEAQRVASDA